MVSQIHTDIQHKLGHHLVNTCPITRVYVPSFSTMVQHLKTPNNFQGLMNMAN